MASHGQCGKQFGRRFRFRVCQFTALDLQALAEGDNGRKAWVELESRMAKYWAESPETGASRNQWKRTGEKLRLWQ